MCPTVGCWWANTSSLVARHNLIYGMSSGESTSASGGNSSLTDGANITGCGTTLIDVSPLEFQHDRSTGILLSGRPLPALFYNNVVYGPLTTNAAVSQTNTSTGFTGQKHIFLYGRVTQRQRERRRQGRSTTTTIIFRSSGHAVQLGAGRRLQFATGKRIVGRDAHLPQPPTPKLTSGGARNLRCWFGSPRFDSGTQFGVHVPARAQSVVFLAGGGSC